ncbi:MAG TPA: phosphatidylserine/phosphatidylglycerophosphate/cardiolipin synthase family protein [Verrucomicrobiae bacterium]|nr:phosphatidylserine/phosphatidylglycerophosphate/cardiolipin synthase family protein [Verrucomicrobiae bacterium]
MVRVACLLLFLLSLVGCSSTALSTYPSVAARPGSLGADGVRLWQDGDIFTLVRDLIASAKQRVMVEMYELGRDDLVEALGAARAAGIEVRVIIDPTVKPSRAAAARLRGLDVSVRAYQVDDNRHQIDHVKLLVADDDGAVGGMNWGRHSDRNHDYVLETRIAAEVARLTRIFDQDWVLAGGHPSPLPMFVGTVAQTAPGGEIRSMIEGALNGAMHVVLAEVYTLTDPALIAELVMAHDRGVEVRVVLDPNQAYNLHAFVVLRAGGVEVRWYPVPRGVLLHAKIGLFDAELVLGSANWTLSGLGVNHELDIETSDPRAVQQYAARFDADWARSRG